MECKCGRQVRTVADRTKPSQRYTVPEKTCGHKHGFIYAFTSAPAEDGMCARCNWKYNRE